MNRHLLHSTFLILAFAVLPSSVHGAQEILLDRIVAVVDEDPIFLSDIRRVIGLGLVEPRDDESETALYRRVLDGLIDQTLRLHEVERHDFGQLPSAEIDQQVARISANFTSEADLEESLDRLGLNREGLRFLVARQLRILIYIEKRLGPRIFIKTTDMRTYFDEVLTLEMQNRGLEVPEFTAVQDQIREVLREERLNTEIEEWTEELRTAADIDDTLERSSSELPPVVQRLE